MKKILIIEDSKYFSRELEETLNGKGFSPVLTGDFLTGSEAILDNSKELVGIILDYKLPLLESGNLEEARRIIHKIGGIEDYGVFELAKGNNPGNLTKELPFGLLLFLLRTKKRLRFNCPVYLNSGDSDNNAEMADYAIRGSKFSSEKLIIGRGKNIDNDLGAFFAKIA